jgi:hypothetical protein
MLQVGVGWTTRTLMVGESDGGGPMDWNACA